MSMVSVISERDHITMSVVSLSFSCSDIPGHSVRESAAVRENCPMACGECNNQQKSSFAEHARLQRLNHVVTMI